MTINNSNTPQSPASAKAVNNINITAERVLITPEQLKKEFPVSLRAQNFIADSRQSIANILVGNDKRKIAVVGPCSIHDLKSAKEYALNFKALQQQVSAEILLVMRVYFEKPRTTTGWKGLINDPHLDNSFDLEKGLCLARELLIWLADQEIPVGTEMLDPICPQYLADLISWAAIGARTSESQTHREMASGLSMPVGFKNGTDGSAEVAINAMKAAASGHSFMGINQQGQVTLLETRGNPFGHVILRGGYQPNYQSEEVAEFKSKLKNAGLQPNIMIDCSHGNSSKDHQRQVVVLEDIVNQILEGNESIIGFMLESHLFSGNQSIALGIDNLRYGVSITDACIDWPSTQACVLEAAELLKDRHLNNLEIRNGVTF